VVKSWHFGIMSVWSKIGILALWSCVMILAFFQWGEKSAFWHFVCVVKSLHLAFCMSGQKPAFWHYASMVKSWHFGTVVICDGFGIFSVVRKVCILSI
jgi:hypothetical protein